MAGAALTSIGPLTPAVMDADTVSLAVKVWVPSVVKVALKTPKLLVRMLAPGRTTVLAWSLEAKATVPV